MASPVPLIGYTVFGTAFTDAVNAGIAALNAVIVQFGGTSTTVADIEAYAHKVEEEIGPAIAARFGATPSTVADVEAYAHRIEDELVAFAGTIDPVRKAAASAVDVADAAAASAQASAAAIGAVAADLQATIPLNTRPGDNPGAFTTDLYAGSTGLPPTALPVTGTGGQSLRVTGPITLGNIGLRSIEPNRLYKVRSAFRRVVDTADPAGAAVTFAVAWYGADRNLLSLPSTEVATVRLAVASGRVQYEALFSPNPPDQTDLGNPRVAQPPAGAAYFRPFLRAFADDVVTDFEVLEHADVTDAAAILPPPIDALFARVTRLEAALNLPAM